MAECIVQPKRDSRPLLLALGVISNPSHSARRSWIRKATSFHTGTVVEQRFVFSRQWACHLAPEQETARDMIFLDAEDVSSSGCVSKAFAWWLFAIREFPEASYIGKTDDDSFNNLAQLQDVLLSFPPGLVYAGWPQFTSFLPHMNTACGWSDATRRALRLLEDNHSNCLQCQSKRPRDVASPVQLRSFVYGPYVFATGALELLSRKLAFAVFGNTWTQEWIADNAAHAKKKFKSKHQQWQPWVCKTEDSFVGYAVSRSVLDLQLSAIFVSLGGLVVDAGSLFLAKRPRDPVELERLITVHKLETNEEQTWDGDAWELRLKEILRRGGHRFELERHKLRNYSRLLAPKLLKIGMTSKETFRNLPSAHGGSRMNFSCHVDAYAVNLNASTFGSSRKFELMRKVNPSIRALFQFPDWKRGWSFCEPVALKKRERINVIQRKHD